MVCMLTWQGLLTELHTSCMIFGGKEDAAENIWESDCVSFAVSQGISGIKLMWGSCGTLLWHMNNRCTQSARGCLEPTPSRLLSCGSTNRPRVCLCFFLIVDCVPYYVCYWGYCNRRNESVNGTYSTSPMNSFRLNKNSIQGYWCFTSAS